MAKIKTGYVDGFVLVIKKKDLATYKKMAQWGEKIWRKYGALDYKECVGDDMRPDMMGMPMRSFPDLAKAKPDELIIFSYIAFKSKVHRDSVNKKVMKDPEMSPEKMQDMPMPFDMKKFSYGGFKVIVGF